jgi:hypothetical protein
MLGFWCPALFHYRDAHAFAPFLRPCRCNLLLGDQISASLLPEFSVPLTRRYQARMHESNLSCEVFQASPMRIAHSTALTGDTMLCHSRFLSPLTTASTRDFFALLSVVPHYG